MLRLTLQVSHIQYERIAGYIALRTGREAACQKKKTPPRRNDSRYWRDGEANKVNAISKGK